MSAMSLLAASAIISVIEILPVAAHKLIIDPYPTNEWNSVLVSSNPIRIFERKQQNNTSKTQKLRQVSRARKRSFEECRENDFKCLYGDNHNNPGHEKDINLDSRFSDSSNLKFDEGELEITDRNPEEKVQTGGKSYWNSMQSYHSNRPYNDKNGWVTLDPVPWSTSKISKWHPNVEIHEPNGPWSFASTTQRPIHQFWVSGSNYRPQKPNIQLGIGSNDIITDNKPSGFPTANFNTYHHSTGFPVSVQHTLIDYKDPFQKFQQSIEPQVSFSDGYSTRFPGGSHPSTYPSQGNGEWILLSTKKGYSPPHKWASKSDLTKTNERIFWSRKIRPTEISRYHEEDLSDKLLISRNSSIKNDSTDQKIMIPIRHYSSEKEGTSASLGSKRKVRLQVLPSPESTLSYGGMLEVDSSPQTVSEDAKLQEAKIKKLQTIANIKRGKFRGYKLVPATRVNGKETNQRSAITLAALGAGMIPATMAVLVPMAFGRSKRSLSAFGEKTFGKVPSQESRPFYREVL